MKENVFIGMTDVGQADSVLNQFRKDYPDDTEGAEKLLADLLEALFSAEQMNGAADHFHNFSVAISKLINDNQKAVDIVKAGLSIFPMNTDLLSDAIKYGSRCGQRKECKEWFETLLSIDKSLWSWRAFSFSIDYLLEECLTQKDSSYTVENVLQLAKDYQLNKPDLEDAWLSEFDIYEETNQREKGIAVLLEAIEKFDLCPKCWLRYADIMIDRGKFDEAKPIVRKMCKNVKSREDINISYVYFLDAQCKINDLYHSEGFDDGEIDEKAVWAIYKSFRKAINAPGLRENVKTQILDLIKELAIETDIEYPDDWRD